MFSVFELIQIIIKTDSPHRWVLKLSSISSEQWDFLSGCEILQKTKLSFDLYQSNIYHSDRCVMLYKK